MLTTVARSKRGFTRALDNRPELSCTTLATGDVFKQDFQKIARLVYRQPFLMQDIPDLPGRDRHINMANA